MSRFASLFAVGLVLSASAQAAPCLFGEDLQSLYANQARFEVKKDVIKTFKMGRTESTNLNEGPILVEVSILKDKQTGIVYHVNETFADEYDGGNTIGWIEEYSSTNSRGRQVTTGDVVAEIGDSEISCLK